MPEETLPSTLTVDNAMEVDVATYIPMLDDLITSREMDEAVGEIDPNKACDRNGNNPGITKLLPPAILLFILQMFNLI